MVLWKSFFCRWGEGTVSRWFKCITYIVYFISNYCCLVAKPCPTLCDPMDCSMLGRLPCPSLSSRVCSDSCLLSQWCHSTVLSLSPASPALNLFQHQSLFQWSALCIRWPKYWSFSFSISPSNEYSELISLRIYWLDLLTVQHYIVIYNEIIIQLTIMQHQWDLMIICICSCSEC